MSLALLTRDNAVVTGLDAGVLGRINEPDVHLAVWRRSLPDELEALIDLDWDELDDIDEAVPLAAFADEVAALLEEAGYPEIRLALGHEIVALGDRFARIMDCDMLRVRLEVVETDACRRFHADYVTARLLMSLVGPGTQWLRTGTEGPIQALELGDVGLFKGRLWAEDPAVLHRSPPVAATGATRLLLALDPCVNDEVAE